MHVWLRTGVAFVLCLSTVQLTNLPAHAFYCSLFPTLPKCCGSNGQPCLFPEKRNSASVAVNGSSQVRTARQQQPVEYMEAMPDYCVRFRQEYLSHCNGVRSTDRSLEWMKFCSAYGVLCELEEECRQCQPEACKRCPQETCSHCPLQRQLPAAVVAGSPKQWSSFDPRYTDFCDSLRLVALKKCTGFEHGRLGELCNLYRQRCPPPASMPSGQLKEWPKTGSNSLIVQQLCEKYRFVFKANCPGYEFQQIRPYCNTYRVYCCGEKPKMIIDGNVAIPSRVWGVGGIPFYPFNPEGLVAGGTKNNIGFGDWGGSWMQSKGVTDFWQQFRGVDANWHAGRFGYSRGFQVPFAGVSGQTSAGVGVGGGGGILGNLGGSHAGIIAFCYELYKAGVIAHMPVM
uniref:ShKT domain-containing protein n=1 Tax=Trichuris muris TaxID=70415 RepID=A0A5S6QTH7_TRIMR